MALGFRKQGLFGSPFGIGGGPSPTWQGNRGYSDDLQQPMPAAMPEPEKKGGGFFGQGGAGRGIAGAIGDYLLQINGMRPIYAPQQHQKQQMLQAEKMRQQQRMEGREDKQWEWENAPRNAGKPHYWETNNGSLAMIDPITGKPSVVYEDPTPKINWMTIDNGDGTKQIVPVGPNGPMMGGTPPMGQLPTFSQDDWDKAGGTGSNVGGGFRR